VVLLFSVAALRNNINYDFILFYFAYYCSWHHCIKWSYLASAKHQTKAPEKTEKVVDKKPPLSLKEKGTRVLKKLNKRIHAIEKTFSKDKKIDKKSPVAALAAAA
jgi:hypothetical protein